MIAQYLKVSSDTFRWAGFAVKRESVQLSLRDSRKLIENDTVFNLKAIERKRWHEERRKERYEESIWGNSDKFSNLLGFY